MILVGVGSNLSNERHGAPIDVCRAALRRFDEVGLPVEARSRWYRTAPVPVSDQPWFVNAVVAVRTDLPPAGLLARLHEVEAAFGRVRRLRNEARVLDLDLLAYGDVVSQDGAEGGAVPVLPHPRLHERAFVLLPLADVAPDWRHPVTGAGLAEMIGRLPSGQRIEVLPGE